MAKVKFITIEDLLERMTNNKKFKLVEVLPEDAFKEGHIPGAINMPLEKIGDLAPKLLKKTDTIITYCASYHCSASTKAAEALLDMGYKNTLDFKGGKKLWLLGGLELEK